MSEKVPFCKKHGILKEGEFNSRLKSGKYKMIDCILCRRDRYKNLTKEDKEKIRKRKKARYDVLKFEEKKNKTCKIHGLIGPDLQNGQRNCILCLKERYQKNKDIYLERNRAIKERNRLNPPLIINCKKHGELASEYINVRGYCKLCHREYTKNYYAKNVDWLAPKRRQYKRNRSHIDNAKRRLVTEERKLKRRAHWKADTVKECIRHGLLTIEQTNKEYYFLKKIQKIKVCLRCTQCLREQYKLVDERRLPVKRIYNLMRSRERSKNLEDGYVRRSLVAQGWDKQSIPSAIVEFKRVILKIKRKVRDGA